MKSGEKRTMKTEHHCVKKRDGNTDFKICLLRKCYLAFNFIHFDSLRSACQISKSIQKFGGRVNKYKKSILPSPGR